MEVALASVVCAGLGYATRRRRRRERILGGFVLCVLLFSLRLNSNSVAKYLSSNIPQERVFLLAGQSNMAGRGGLVKKNNQVKKVFDPLMLQHQFERDLVVADGRVERLTADMRWIPGKPPPDDYAH
ncbi:hypothetical protein BASA81_005420 [Batrachochytrium salamandrivorans]|nr:hypothetical protein BASA81_005420 [Batrachochytrium salamandrivorans]